MVYKDGFETARIRANFICTIDVVYSKSCMMTAPVHLRHFLTLGYTQKTL